MIQKVFAFYHDGFSHMRLGKKLWLLIAIKLFILFAIVKVLFFPNILEERFQTDRERSDYILQQLTQHKGNNNGTP